MALFAGQILTADALRAAVAEPGSQLLDEATLSADGDVTFSDIDQGFSSLLLTVNGMNNGTAVHDVNLQLNANTANNYSWFRSGRTSNTGGGHTFNEFDISSVGNIAFGRIGASWRSSVTCWILDYSSTSATATHSQYSAIDGNDPESGNAWQIGQGTGLYFPGEPISEVRVFMSSAEDLAASTGIRLYGLA